MEGFQKEELLSRFNPFAVLESKQTRITLLPVLDSFP